MKFRHDDYLAIYSFILLSYVVEVDAWLGEQCGLNQAAKESRV